MGAARDVAVSEHRAFALGSDGGVWCLRAPANTEELVRASSRAAAAAAAADLDVGDATEGSSKMLDPEYHAERLSARLRAAAPAKTAGGGGPDDDSVATTVRGMTPWERANSNESPRVAAAGSGRRGVASGASGVRGLARGRISRRRRRRRTPSGSSRERACRKNPKRGTREQSRRGSPDGWWRRKISKIPTSTPRPETDEDTTTAGNVTPALEGKDPKNDAPEKSPADAPTESSAESTARRSRAVAGEEEAATSASLPTARIPSSTTDTPRVCAISPRPSRDRVSDAFPSRRDLFCRRRLRARPFSPCSSRANEWASPPAKAAAAAPSPRRGCARRFRGRERRTSRR